MGRFKSKQDLLEGCSLCSLTNQYVKVTADWVYMTTISKNSALYDMADILEMIGRSSKQYCQELASD